MRDELIPIEHDFHRVDAGNQRSHIDEIVSTYGITKADLLVQSNDPFNAGTDLHGERAKWFRSLYDLAGGDAFKGHLRDLHYKVNALRPDLYDGSGESWDTFQDAKKLAVALGLVAADALDDRSISRQFDVDRWGIGLTPIAGIVVPEAEPFTAPRTTFISPATVCPVDMLLWVEKPSPMIEAEVWPVCERYGVDVRFGRGSPNHAFVGHLARRAANSGRELVLMGLSDADFSGSSMARSLARNSEAIVRMGLIDGVLPRVRVVRADFTVERVAQIEQRLRRTIPRTVDGKTGEERVELQALPALVPGELAQIVEEAIVSVVGEDWLTVVDAWERDLDETLSQSDEAAELEALSDEIEEFVNSEEYARVREQLEAFEEQRVELAGALREIVVETKLPEMEEPETNWLLDTDRSYLEQVQAYRRHDGLEPLVFEERVCVVCGTPISGNPVKTTCSALCRHRLQHQRRRDRKPVLPTRVCAYCATTFQPRRKDQRFCSSEHQIGFAAQRRRAYAAGDSGAKPNGVGGESDV